MVITNALIVNDCIISFKSGKYNAFENLLEDDDEDEE
jgi:hypothetical protein